MDPAQQAFSKVPSYALEDSDGEEDVEGQHEAPEVELDGGSSELQQQDEVVFLVGEAGESFARGLLANGLEGQGAVKVLVDGIQAASVVPGQGEKQPCLVFITPAVALQAIQPLALSLLTALAPKRVTIVASYNLPTYLGAGAQRPAVRYLAPSKRDLPTLPAVLQPFQPPNLHHGIAAALLSTSALLFNATSLLLLLPTVSPPEPLNGATPGSISYGGTYSLFDAGGPTALSEPGALFAESLPQLEATARALGWEGWWDAKKAKAERNAQGWSWLEDLRRAKRREVANSGMYM